MYKQLSLGLVRAFIPLMLTTIAFVAMNISFHASNQLHQISEIAKNHRPTRLFKMEHNASNSDENMIDNSPGKHGYWYNISLLKYLRKQNPFHDSRRNEGWSKNDHRRRLTKLIAHWGPQMESYKPLSFDQCEFKDCKMTRSVRKADVVWMETVSFKYDLPLPPKQHGQIWLLGSRDPPTLKNFELLNRSDLRGKFNWTWTMDRTSTWQARYGHLQERSLPSKNYVKIYRRKCCEVAWFVSQCDRPSRRMEYVRRMATRVDVHIFGTCGNRTCGNTGNSMGGQREFCMGMLSKKYKFYLSFENSFCRDYVTEKFFNIFRDVDTIPVVRGGFDYHANLPPGILVNAADFPSPEALGDYLRELGGDEKRYVAMLKQKSRFIKTENILNMACEVCRGAHLQKPQHIYEDVHGQLAASADCWSPADL